MSEGSTNARLRRAIEDGDRVLDSVLDASPSTLDLKSRIVRCVLRKRSGDGPLFFANESTNHRLSPNLEGYAIVPIEDLAADLAVARDEALEEAAAICDARTRRPRGVWRARSGRGRPDEREAAAGPDREVPMSLPASTVGPHHHCSCVDCERLCAHAGARSSPNRGRLSIVRYWGSPTDLATDVAPLLTTDAEVEAFVARLRKRVAERGR